MSMSEDEEKDMYAAEVSAFERAAPGGKLAELITITTDEKKLTPRERFYKNVDAISRRINSENVVRVSQHDIDTMLETATNVEDIQYRNPVGYVLGYLASGGGREMNRKKIMEIINDLLPKLDGDGGVEPPDVIRYARYWTIVLK